MTRPPRCSALRLVVALTLGAAASIATATPLQGRDLDGNTATYEAWYDVDQNVTWLTDWGLAPAGRRTWAEAMDWADGLSLWGYNDWRLPRMGNGDGCANADLDVSWNCKGVGNELGYLWYVLLNNTAAQTHFAGPFLNMPQTAFWTQTTGPRSGAERYVFSTFNGAQYLTNAAESVPYATAVRTGDVAAPAPNPVSVPGSGVLVGLGMLGLMAARRRRAA